MSNNKMSTKFGSNFIKDIMYVKGLYTIYFIRLVTDFSPEIVLLQTGGNDIDSGDFKYNVFINTLKSFLGDLRSKTVK